MAEDRHSFYLFALSVITGLAGLLTARLLFSSGMVYFINVSIFLPLLIALALPAEYSVIAGIVGFGIFIPVVEHPAYGYANMIEVFLLYALFLVDGKFTACGKLPENAWEQCRPYIVNTLFSVFYIIIHVSVMSEVIRWNPPEIKGLAYDISEKSIVINSLNFMIWLLLMTAASKIMLYLPAARKLLQLEKTEDSHYSRKLISAMLFVIISYYLTDFCINNFIYHKPVIYDYSYFYTAYGLEKVPMFVLGVFAICDFLLFSNSGKYLTERKLAETKKQYQKIFHNMTASYEELESFCCLLSHEIKNPLHEIEAYADIIIEDNSENLDIQSRNDMEAIKKVCSHMLDLSDSMMKYSKVGYTIMNPCIVDMNALVGIVLANSIKTHPEKKFKVSVAELHKVYGDEFLLQQMTVNIIGNSVKFSIQRPVVQLKIWSKAENGKITFFFQDNGIGFEQEDAGKLFRLFERLHSRTEFEGNGIGLAMVLKIVQRHHGKVSITGKKNKGCTVRVSFPDRTV